LMRSGIGPAADLRALGVDVVADRPAVGENLCDHPLVQINVELLAAGRSSPATVRAYNCGLRTKSQSGADDDLSMFAANYGQHAGEGSLSVELMRPHSRGRLRLRSANPGAQPWIEFRMLSDPRDLAALRDGVRRALELARHPALARISTNPSAPGLSSAVAADDRALDDWLSANCEEFLHAVGTCWMGARDDPRSVVDCRGRVIGVEGLLVCDASIMPIPPRAPTHLSAVMIAEHMAAMLRGRDG
jgi:choline dehydrogenase-like flavoprotein